MSKRKMPAHIVLPNGMWRFVKGKAKAISSRRIKKAKTKRKGVYMAKRRKSFGGSKSSLMGGIIKPKGIVASALMGAGTATLIENTGFAPFGNMTGVVAGFATAGLGGALGAYARSAIKGQLGTSGSYASGY